MAKVKTARLVDAVASILSDKEAYKLLDSLFDVMVEALVDTLADTLAEEKTETLFDT